MTKAKRIGDIKTVKNTKKHWAANSQYSHLRAQFTDGYEVHLLFTDAEIKRAIERAKKNPEDCPRVSWLRDLLD
jgi:hypothetical protein